MANDGNGLAIVASVGKLTTTSGETAGTAAAAHAQALVQARYIMALQRPRDWDDVRVRLLKACERPMFAETAIYAKPVGGGKVEGPSIRFAEEAARAMGNLDVKTPVIYEDAAKRLINVSVTDLESNTTYSSDVSVEKTVERKKVKEGQTVIGTRQNSYGDLVYIVAATEDDLLNKTNALVSKSIRTGILRVLPSDIREEAVERAKSTMRRGDAADPDAARKKLVDAFAKLGVTPAALKQYLEHDVATCSPAELEQLRAVYVAIKDGDASWNDIVKAKAAESAPEGDAPKTRSQAAKDVAKKAAQPKAAADHNPVTGEVDDGTLSEEEEARMKRELEERGQ